MGVSHWGKKIAGLDGGGGGRGWMEGGGGSMSFFVWGSNLADELNPFKGF